MWTALLFAPVGLEAQSKEAPRVRRLSITIDAGLVVGGPSGGLYDQLESAGFGSDRRNCYRVDAPPGTVLHEFVCGTPIYPKLDGPGAGYGMYARYAVNNVLSVGASYVRTDLGGAEGFNLEWDRHNSTAWYSSSVAVTAFWMRNWLRVGAGAGLYSLDNTLALRLDVGGADRLGMVMELGVQSNTSSDVFIDSAIRLHVVPPKDLAFSTRFPEDPVLTLRPNWTHLTVSVGLGIRP